MNKFNAYVAAYRGARATGDTWVIIRGNGGHTWDAARYVEACRRSFPMGPFDTFYRFVNVN